MARLDSSAWVTAIAAVVQAAALLRVSAKKNRYYESVGLLKTAARRENGYRDYDETDVCVLKFVQRSRDLGFSLEETGQLLTLWRDRKRSSRVVRQIAEQHIEKLQQRIAEMTAMADTLHDLVASCSGSDRPD